MFEIKVVIDEGGIFQGLYVSPEISDCDVELIDFVTDDPDELESAGHALDEAARRAMRGELELVF